MIILFDEAEQDFTSLGLGILRDAIECTVEEKLNDTFELSLTYPTTGKLFSKLRIGRIIYAKPNPYDNAQPFRIYNISKPLKGTVSISAQHISYDMNGIPCKAIDATGLNDALSQIQNGAYITHKFTLSTNISSARTFKTTSPYNMRALLMGDDDESLLGVFDGEVKFDKFNAMIYSKRGKDRGAQVSYGYNMTDLTHETNTDLLYNGVFPYYHSETTSSETTTEDTFTQVYIVGATPFVDGWFSYTKDGEAYHPLDSTPVQVATEGDYYQKVYAWDSTYQKYVEKLYNQTITLVEGVTEPTWIAIEWSSFPTVTCRANAKGYFKLSTDDNWGDEKGVGDIIFQGNILSSGLTEMASNLILYYSEVVPSGATSTTKEVSEIEEVILDDPIIKINTTDATSMKYDRILSLDLTSEFDEAPTKDALKAKAEEYISENKVGTVKHNTTVSFIDLATTTEADKYKNFDHIELGDTVRVIYKDLGVDVQLRAITTTYDAISDKYTSVELGEKEDSLSANSIQNGDSISSLTNDAGYTDITTVNKLIANTVTAEYIQAVNAKLTKAQIDELTTAKISCTGIIEATQFVLDELIATLLTAENAKVSDTLEAGKIKVAGDITVNSGQISISGDDGTTFNVDRDGNMKANSVEITGGTLSINDGAFEVTNDGVLTATAGQIGDCVIDEDGSLKVPAANIEGEVTANSLTIKDKNDAYIIKADNTNPDNTIIGGFTVDSKSLKNGLTSIDDTETTEGIYVGKDGIKLGQNFAVDIEGNVVAKTLKTITSVDTDYNSSDNDKTPPLTGWVTDVSEVGDGQYMWTRVKTTYTTVNAEGEHDYDYKYSVVTNSKGIKKVELIDGMLTIQMIGEEVPGINQVRVRGSITFVANDDYAVSGTVEYNSDNFSNYSSIVSPSANYDSIMDKSGDLYSIKSYDSDTKIITYNSKITTLKGGDGIGISDVSLSDGYLTIKKTDGTTPINKIKVKGNNGLGIKQIKLNEGRLTIEMEDGSLPVESQKVNGDSTAMIVGSDGTGMIYLPVMEVVYLDGAISEGYVPGGVYFNTAGQNVEIGGRGEQIDVEKCREILLNYGYELFNMNN